MLGIKEKHLPNSYFDSIISSKRKYIPAENNERAGLKLKTWKIHEQEMYIYLEWV